MRRRMIRGWKRGGGQWGSKEMKIKVKQGRHIESNVRLRFDLELGQFNGWKNVKLRGREKLEDKQ